MALSSRRNLLSLAGSGALVAVLAACASSTPPMAGSSAGAAAPVEESAARALAGQGCPPTSQGLPRVGGGRGDTPVVLRSGPPRGSAARPAGTVSATPEPADSCP